MPGWATAIAAGPADESGQTLTFVVTNNTNAALFSVAPGGRRRTATLTFTPAPNAYGDGDDHAAAGRRRRHAERRRRSRRRRRRSTSRSPTSTTRRASPTGANQTVLEDAGPQTVAGWATALSPGPNESGQVLTFEVTNNTNAALFSAAPAVDGTTGTLTFTPAPNAVGSATITLRLHDDGGTADGGVDVSPTQQFTITVDPVNDAPSFTKGARPDRARRQRRADRRRLGDRDQQGRPGRVRPDADLRRHEQHERGALLGGPGGQRHERQPDLHARAERPRHGDDHAAAGRQRRHAERRRRSVRRRRPSTSRSPTSTTRRASPRARTRRCSRTPARRRSPAGRRRCRAGPNESGQVLTFEVTSNTNPALFSAGPAVSGTTGTLTFTPAANAVGTATITLRLHDDGGTATAASTCRRPRASRSRSPGERRAELHEGREPDGRSRTAARTRSPAGRRRSARAAADESGQTLTFVVTNNTNPSLFSAGPAVARERHADLHARRQRLRHGHDHAAARRRRRRR